MFSSGINMVFWNKLKGPVCSYKSRKCWTGRKIPAETATPVTQSQQTIVEWFHIPLLSQRMDKRLVRTTSFANNARIQPFSCASTGSPHFLSTFQLGRRTAAAVHVSKSNWDIRRGRQNTVKAKAMLKSSPPCLHAIFNLWVLNLRLTHLSAVPFSFFWPPPRGMISQISIATHQINFTSFCHWIYLCPVSVSPWNKQPPPPSPKRQRTFYKYSSKMWPTARGHSVSVDDRNLPIHLQELNVFLFKAIADYFFSLPDPDAHDEASLSYFFFFSCLLSGRAFVCCEFSMCINFSYFFPKAVVLNSWSAFFPAFLRWTNTSALKYVWKLSEHSATSNTSL